MIKTEILPQEEGINQAAELILKGELVAFATETVYGLGADYSNADAVKKIFEAKGRPQDNPLIVHIAKSEDASLICDDIPLEYFELAKKFMPGPLTVVLKKKTSVPDIVTAGGQTVAVRTPQNVWARKLIELSRPLAAPSANRSKHISPTTAQHVYNDLNGRIKLILDGGECNVGIESTVLDLTESIPTILRPGAVTAEMLSQIFCAVKENNTVKLNVAKSPGMKYEHYAPNCTAVIAKSTESAAVAYDKAKNSGLKPIYLCLSCEDFSDKEKMELGKSVEDFAKNYYSALRIAENNYNFIIIQELKGGGLAASVMNRAIKSANCNFV